MKWAKEGEKEGSGEIEGSRDRRERRGVKKRLR
jgi:hypothetical protein